MVALGSDIDNLLGASQYSGIPNIKLMVKGRTGACERPNSGMPLMIAAAIAVKGVMEKNHLPGRLMIGPGVAEELLGTKAYYVRAELFEDVDTCLFSHVNTGFCTGYGNLCASGMVSVKYSSTAAPPMPPPIRGTAAAHPTRSRS